MLKQQAGFHMLQMADLQYLIRLLNDLLSPMLQVTDMLMLKQNQLEQMAAEKAANQMNFERALATAREEADRARR